MTDFATYTNTALEAVVVGSLSPDDLQLFREEMQDRGLSTIAPPTVPSTPPPAPNTLELQSAGSVGYYLGVEDDGSLRTTQEADPVYQRIHMVLPPGITDGQTVIYDAAENRMIAAEFGAELLTADSTSELLTDETGYSVLIEG